MKISIITVCYNSEKTIARTIESVLNQKYENIEYIIIDGLSIDSTLKIAESYRIQFESKGIDFVIKSERDNGIYDAMNKGITLSSGDVIGILNSDDYYSNNNVIERVMMNFSENKELDSLYGNLVYEKNDRPYRYWKSGKPRTFKFGWMPPHPAFFVKKYIYEKYGLFRMDCGTAADYEFLLRILEKFKISTLWLDEVLVYMSAGGASGENIQAYKKSHKSDINAWKLNSINPLLGFAWMKKIRKLPQFVSAIFYKKKK